MAQHVTLAEVPKTTRINRHPQHPFAIRHRPWQIAPFHIAAVLPGETLRNLLLQSRVVSDPVKSSLVGWWIEYYFYYVKHRDLGGRDTFASMMTDPTTSLAAFNQAALAEYYHATTTISWVKECLQRVTEWDFRVDGETWNGFTIGNLPAAQIMQRIEKAANAEQGAKNRKNERSRTKGDKEIMRHLGARRPNQVVRAGVGRIDVRGNVIPVERRHRNKQQQSNTEQHDSHDVVEPPMLRFLCAFRAYRIFSWHEVRLTASEGRSKLKVIRR